MTPFLTGPQLAAELSSRPGLIPVSIDHLRRQITWLDLNGYHCYEGFFRQSLASYRALRKNPPARFLAGLDVLESPLPGDCLPPTGFIFHAGRCGSTLLAKVLARSRANMVFSEAGPHNQIWRVLPESRPAAIEIYRNLILAMGRRRLQSHRAHFIKLTSFNIVRFEFIRAAFPGVPALFLFRNPGEVLASYARVPPRWRGKDFGTGSAWSNAAAAVEDFCHAAAAIDEAAFRRLDYADLTSDSLPAILRFLGGESSDEERRAMFSEFAWDSKGGATPRKFNPGQRTGVSPAGTTLRLLYQQLKEQASCDWPRLNSTAPLLRKSLGRG